MDDLATNMRVLVVDDEKNIRATLAMCLESMGCDVAIASSPQSALAALAERTFDMAFVDLRCAIAAGSICCPPYSPSGRNWPWSS